jgi:hypothetical protein
MRWTLVTAVGLVVAVGMMMGAATSKPSTNPTTGTLVGTVVDVNGNPAADCIVTAQQAAEKMRDGLQGKTDSNGKFKFEKVPEGDYNLNVRSRDLKFKAIKSLTVDAGQTTDVGTLKLKGV